MYAQTRESTLGYPPVVVRDADSARAVSQAAHGLADAAAKAVHVQVRGELVKLIRGVMDAQSASAAEAALAQLLSHPYGQGLGKQLSQLMARLVVYQLDYCRGLQRVSPEWYWRDFRSRNPIFALFVGIPLQKNVVWKVSFILLGQKIGFLAFSPKSSYLATC